MHSCRAGQFLLEGTLSTVSLTNTGAGTAVISGLSQSIDLNIGGVGSVFINAVNGGQLIFACECLCT